MNNKSLISFKTVESHTMGEPTRIIVEGFPKLEGASMMDKKNNLVENYDCYRTALMLEPRGHRDMFGALFTSPVNKEADIGVIFMDSGGYLNMCGHGSIGSATVAVETGRVKITTPYTNVVLDTPAGIIRSKVLVEDGKAKEVSIKNVPAFLYKEDLQLELKGYGTVTFDISFGGSFFALVDSEKLGIEIKQENLNKLTDFGMKLREKINKTIEIKHPYLDITTVDLVEIYGPPDSEKANKKNVVIFGDSQADRSPCGTGTSAKVATLYAKGELKLGEEFVYESITGSLFRGKALSELDINGIKSIVPEITGSAYITGYNEWIIDEDDPLKYGFLMGGMIKKKNNQSRKFIIQEAWNLFRKNGYEETTIEDIIEASQISNKEFAKYFHEKEELLYTLSDLFDQRYAELMLEIDPELSCYDKLVILNRELFTMIENRIPMELLAFLYSTQMVDKGDKHLLDKNRLYYKIVRDIMKSGIKSGEFGTTENVDGLVSTYAMLERGLLCEWCIGQKKEALTQVSKKLMPILLHSIIS